MTAQVVRLIDDPVWFAAVVARVLARVKAERR